VLTTKFKLDKTEVAKIWSFGPDGEGPNMIVDATISCQYMNEIKDHMVSGFEIVTKSGVLCEETLRSVKFSVEDTSLHTDAIHRGAGQITPATRKVLYGAELMASPTL
jgi:elongation factor 2